MAEIERLSIALPSPMARGGSQGCVGGRVCLRQRSCPGRLAPLAATPSICTTSMRTYSADAGTKGKASGRAGPLDVKRVLAEERAAFKGAAVSVTELFVSHRAEADLRDIWHYIAA